MLAWTAAILMGAQASAAAKIPDCHAAPAYHRLDFWIGDWDTFETGEPHVTSEARARIEPIAQGCALHELYEQTDGLIGDSILSYDPVQGAWQQTWVTNRGAIMVLHGRFLDNDLVLEGESHLQNGQTIHQRITWQQQGDRVHEFAVASKDGGKTWQPAFDVTFVRRKAAPRHAGTH